MNSLTVPELKSMAKLVGLKGYSKMTKSELLVVLKGKKKVRSRSRSKTKRSCSKSRSKTKRSCSKSRSPIHASSPSLHTIQMTLYFLATNRTVGEPRPTHRELVSRIKKSVFRDIGKLLKTIKHSKPINIQLQGDKVTFDISATSYKQVVEYVKELKNFPLDDTLYESMIFRTRKAPHIELGIIDFRDKVIIV